MILIDTPMPENCFDCPACNEYLMCAIPVDGRGWGENDVREYEHGRPEWCPLKEQEAIEPKKESEDMPEKWASWWYVCGNCGREIDWHDRYCRHCGKAVKWDE